MITEEGLGFQKERKKKTAREWVKIWVNIVSYPSHEFLRSYLMVEAKIKTASIWCSIYVKETLKRIMF